MVVNSKAKPIQGTSIVDLKVGEWEGKCSLMVVPLDDLDMILGINFFLKAKPIQGTLIVDLKVGEWEGECSLMVVHLDDFDMIFGIDFFLKTKVGLVPYLSEIFIHDEKSPCFVIASFAGRLVYDKQK